MKLGIYGGTFNPVHYGHLRTAEEVRDVLSLDSILFIPSGKTPFQKPDLASARHRYEMVKKAIRGNSSFKISDIETRKRSRTFSVDTLRELRNNYPGAELYFILGIDAFTDLPEWKDPESLVSMTHLVVLSRPGYTFGQLSSTPFLGNASLKLLRTLDRGEGSVVSAGTVNSMKIFLCNVTELNISASMIRSLCKEGKKLNYLLPDSVNSYIISNKLYK
jgi:nicotinate-nucleotide adenylyltransferase